MPRHVTALAITLMLLVVSTACAEPIQPLAVQNGRCECVLKTDRADDQFMLVLGSLSQNGGTFNVRIDTEGTDAPEAITLEQPLIDPAWQARVKDLAECLAKARRQRVSDKGFEPREQPVKEKTFHLFVSDGDFHNPANYVAVAAQLRGVGRHCQVYVDRDYPDGKNLQPTIDEAIRIYDSEVLPRALGNALDVDRDGRFTIFFSRWLAKMQTGPVKLSGFVRGSDFYRDLAPPFGNRCDMMYLSTDLKPEPFLRTLIAHEYTHAVIFSEHVFGDYFATAPRQDEQSWLNEAIAHLVEDAHGYGWANLDYRISAFLNAPGRYSLIVPDYYGAKVWRDPGTRGCTYLFLRWCVDRFGPELLTRLVQSNLSGVENLEVATQTPFAELFRQWSAALACCEGVPALTGINLHGNLGSRVLCGPRFDSVKLTARQEVPLRPTSVDYVLLHSPAAARSRVTITCDPKAQLQVSVMRLPKALPRLDLQAEVKGDGDITLSLTAHHAAVTLEEIAWERMVTREEPNEDTSFQAARASGETVTRWFKSATLQAGECRQSVAVRVPEGEVVFKVAGHDALGRQVSAWTVVSEKRAP